MRKLWIAAFAAGSLLAAACRSGETPSDGAPRKGMVPASQHEGKPFEIPAPESKHQPAAGRIETGPETFSTTKETYSVEGTLVKRGPRSLEVKGHGGEVVELKVPGSIHVSQGNESISASQLHEGALIRASYELDGEEKVAKELELLQEKQR